MSEQKKVLDEQFEKLYEMIGSRVYPDKRALMKDTFYIGSAALMMLLIEMQRTDDKDKIRELQREISDDIEKYFAEQMAAMSKRKSTMKF